MHADTTTKSVRLNCDACGKEFKRPRCHVSKGRHFCGRTCFHAARKRLGCVRKPGPVAERFWKYVQKTEGCWLWTGTLIEKGYGRFTLGQGAKVVAHRMAYELARGPIPDGLQVCHDCDRFYPPGDITYRRCVRPDHLFLGTNSDNQQDAKLKGRRAVGERSGMARFTEAQVLDMRSRYKSGEVTQRQLAWEYDTKPSVVWMIVSGKRWAHLPL